MSEVSSLLPHFLTILFGIGSYIWVIKKIEPVFNKKRNQIREDSKDKIDNSEEDFNLELFRYLRRRERKIALLNTLQKATNLSLLLTLFAFFFYLIAVGLDFIYQSILLSLGVGGIFVNMILLGYIALKLD